MPPFSEIAIAALEAETSAEGAAGLSRQIIQALPEIAGPGAAHSLEPAAMEAFVSKIVEKVRGVLEDPSVLKHPAKQIAYCLESGVAEVNRGLGFPAPRISFNLHSSLAVGDYAQAEGSLRIGYQQLPLILAKQARVAGSTLSESGATLAGVVAHEDTHLLQDTLITRRFIDLNPSATFSDWLKVKRPDLEAGSMRFDQSKRFFDEVVQLRAGKELPPALAATADIMAAALPENGLVMRQMDQLTKSGLLDLKELLPEIAPSEMGYAKFWNEFPRDAVPPSIEAQWEATKQLVSSGSINEAQAGKDFYFVARKAYEEAAQKWDVVYQQYASLPHEKEARAAENMARRMFSPDSVVVAASR